MPIYTGTGDAGETGLGDNERVAKDDLRIEAYGTVDELNSTLGLLRCENLPPDLDRHLERIQNTLFELGSDLANPGPGSAPIDDAVRELEEWIDASEAQLPPLRNFILPGGHREAALLHLLRTTARRAERRFWTLRRRDGLDAGLGVYLNRLSDLFFSWARNTNRRHDVDDVVWPGRT